jgi:outer membrane protein assembly factor BamB
MVRWLIGILVGLTLPSPVSLAVAEEWPRWRGPRGDGTWQGPRLPERWPDEGLKTAWRQPIGGGYSGPSVADGRLTIMDRQTDPGEVERVLAFDAATGKALWEHAYPVAYGKLDYGNGPRATPTHANGRLYTLGAVGHLHCLDVETGRVIWSRDLVKDFGAVIPEWGLAASPVVWRDLVIVHPGAKPGGTFMAFDAETGDERWRAGDDPAGYCTPIVIEIDGREQLVGWTPEHVLGLHPETGEVQWSEPYKVTYGVSIATPVFHRGVAFVTGYWEGSKAIRLGPTVNDAELVWEDRTDLQGLMSQPLCRDGYAYCLDKDRGLVCFEMETGRQLWTDEHEMTPRGRNPHATLAWLGDGDRAIILNSEGDLILSRLNPDGYHEQSRVNIIQPNPGPIWAHPALAGDRFYARNDDELICVELPTIVAGGE